MASSRKRKPIVIRDVWRPDDRVTQRLQAAAEAVPVEEVVTTRALAHAAGYSYEYILRKLRAPQLSPYRITVGASVYWGNPKTVQQFHHERENHVPH
jgi:hypothetical protein